MNVTLYDPFGHESYFGYDGGYVKIGCHGDKDYLFAVSNDSTYIYEEHKGSVSATIPLKDDIYCMGKKDESDSYSSRHWCSYSNFKPLCNPISPSSDSPMCSERQFCQLDACRNFQEPSCSNADMLNTNTGFVCYEMNNKLLSAPALQYYHRYLRNPNRFTGNTADSCNVMDYVHLNNKLITFNELIYLSSDSENIISIGMFANKFKPVCHIHVSKDISIPLGQIGHQNMIYNFSLGHLAKFADTKLKLRCISEGGDPFVRTELSAYLLVYSFEIAIERTHAQQGEAITCVVRNLTDGVEATTKWNIDRFGKTFAKKDSISILSTHIMGPQTCFVGLYGTKAPPYQSKESYLLQTVSKIFDIQNPIVNITLSKTKTHLTEIVGSKIKEMIENNTLKNMLTKFIDSKFHKNDKVIETKYTESGSDSATVIAVIALLGVLGLAIAVAFTYWRSKRALQQVNSSATMKSTTEEGYLETQSTETATTPQTSKKTPLSSKKNKTISKGTVISGSKFEKAQVQAPWNAKYIKGKKIEFGRSSQVKKTSRSNQYETIEPGI